jgi:hypothetical protein
VRIDEAVSKEEMAAVAPLGPVVTPVRAFEMWKPRLVGRAVACDITLLREDTAWVLLVATGLARIEDTKDRAPEGWAPTTETTDDSPVGATLTDTPAETLTEAKGVVDEERLLETVVDDTMLAEVMADDVRLVNAVVEAPEPPSPMDRRAELWRRPTPRPPRRVAPELPPMRARFSRSSCS